MLFLSNYLLLLIKLGWFWPCYATFTQQQNTVVSPVFETLIRLCSHSSFIYGCDIDRGIDTQKWTLACIYYAMGGIRVVG